MNCPQCGHPKQEHIIHRGEGRCINDPGKNYALCGCSMMPSQIELSHLQARLTLARELIAALTNNGQLSPRLMTPETRGAWERWQAEEMK